MHKLGYSIFLGALISGCAATNDLPSCEEALQTLSGCSDPDQAECADDGAAARRVQSGDCSVDTGKADWFGNRTWGESCSWNWQCQGDTRHSCNHGTCYLRAEVGNSCDRGDDNDCAEGLQCVDDVSVPTAPVGLCYWGSGPVAPALYAETVRQGEEQDFQAQAGDIMALQMKAAVERLNGDDKVRRAFHAKKHACVPGSFEVFSGPSDLAVGPVFSQPQTFPAWVRLSNGTLTIGPDEDSAIQGLAIKLVGVGGSKILEGQTDAVTQDFLMINIPGNVVASSNEFVEFAKIQASGGLASAHYLVTHPRTAARVLALVAFKKVESARVESYWAGNASRHGEQLAVKYSAQPCEGTPGPAGFEGADFLREDVKQQLASGEVCFDFYVQVQTDSLEMSIEDGTSIWDETVSVPVRMARLTIPATALDTPAVDALEATCEELSFNPWNSSPSYRPLGNMNRSRRHAYEASRNMRHAAPEPTQIP